MEFNSTHFVIFFAIVFVLNWILTAKYRPALILTASCLFYAAWDWRFLGLLLWVVCIDYLCMRAMNRHQQATLRRIFASISILNSLGILLLFKYFNFFADSLSELLAALSLNLGSPSLRLILPLGISFYTFRSVSASVDVYRKDMAAPSSFLHYAAYITFFPCITAGPIERGPFLIPQIRTAPTPNSQLLLRGVFLFLYGLYQKNVIADNLASIVHLANQSAVTDGNFSALLTVLYGYPFRILCDFAGYSNMARGTAALLGFDVSRNFNAPYYAKSFSEFWHRWHITLSTWLRDYVYIPLGGNRKGSAKTLRNLFVTMLIGGLWHGASWAFVAWGGIHGILLVIDRIWQTLSKTSSQKYTPRWGSALQHFVFLNVLALTWVFFRVSTVAEAFHFFGLLFHPDSLAPTQQIIQVLPWIATIILPFLLLDFLEYKHKDVATGFLRLSWPVQALIYVTLFYEIVLLGVNNAQSFIYAQF